MSCTQVEERVKEILLWRKGTVFTPGVFTYKEGYRYGSRQEQMEGPEMNVHLQGLKLLGNSVCLGI